MELPSYSKFSDDIATIDTEIKKLEESRTKLEQAKKSLEEYRNLLSTQGEELVTIVQKVLGDFGLQTKRTPPGFVVDLIKEKELAVEITGTADKIDSDTDKIFQLMQFLEKHHKSEKILLVANTYRRLPSEDRKGKQDFTPKVLDYLKLQDICVMSTLTLFEYWKWSYDDGSKRKTVRERILTTKGELKFTEK